MSPGNASSMVERSRPNIACAYLVANGRPVASWVRTMPRSNRPEQTRTKATRSRCDLSIEAWTLNTSPENGDSMARASPDADGRGEGGGRQLDQRVQQPGHADVGQRRAEHHRRRDAGLEGLDVEVGADLAEQLELLGGALPVHALLGGGRVGVEALLGGLRGAVGGAGEPAHGAVGALDEAVEVPGDPDRPGDRHGAQPDPLLDLVDQLQRLAARAVPLVDEGQDRHAAGAADVEELEGLRLETAGGVEEHHRGVDGGEHAVGVLGEVAVAGGVEQVDDVVAVGELEHRRGHRDAALALHVHPVGRDALAPALPVDRARRGDHLGVQRERLGERGLARVGVGDHGEGPAALRLARRGAARARGVALARTGVRGGHGHRVVLPLLLAVPIKVRLRPAPV